nr:cupin domain-containing protein [Microbulbifer sediminum]
MRRDWARRGYSFGLWTDPPGQRWDDFVHDVDELLLLAEGKLEVEMGGRTWRPAIGEEIHIPAGTSHSVRNIGDTTAKWFYGYRGP